MAGGGIVARISQKYAQNRICCPKNKQKEVEQEKIHRKLFAEMVKTLFRVIF
jgi:hypothetical protein